MIGATRTFGGQKHQPLPDPGAGAFKLKSFPPCEARFRIIETFCRDVQDDEKCCGSLTVTMARVWPNWELRAPITFCAQRSNRSLWIGIQRMAISRCLRRSLDEGWSSTARITKPTMKSANGRIPRHARPQSTVVLIPGLGMIAWGKNKSESRVTAEFYNCAIEVMRGAEAIDQYEAMDQQEAFDIEYWPLEEAKLRRMPPEKELDRQASS